MRRNETASGAIVALALALPAGCDQPPDTMVNNGDWEIGDPDRIGPPGFTLVETGSGEPSVAPLWPMRVGAMWGDNVVEGITRRSGYAMMRVVHPYLPDPLGNGEENPPTVSFYSQGESGLVYHGNTRTGIFVQPLVLLPSEVRVGMIWDSSIDNFISEFRRVAVRFEVTDRSVEPTIFGEQIVWTIVETVVSNGELLAEWRWIEGFGPPRSRVFLPEEPQPGIDVDHEDGVAPSRLDYENVRPELLAIGGPTRSFDHFSSVVLSGGPYLTIPHAPLHRRVYACVTFGPTRLGVGEPVESSYARLERDECQAQPDPDGRRAAWLRGHSGLALPLDGGVWWADGAWNGTVDPFRTASDNVYVNLGAFLGADGSPRLLSQAVPGDVPLYAQFGRRHESIRVGPASEMIESRIAARWVGVDQVNHFVVSHGGPRWVLAHDLDAPTSEGRLTLRSASGAFLSSSLGPDGIGRPELRFFKAGGVHFELRDDHRSFLVTTPDGLVHRLEPDGEDGVRLVRIAQVDLPARESLVGAAEIVGEDEILVVTAIDNFFCDTLGRCERPHDAYRVALAAERDDQPPPSHAVSAVRDGWDVLVCWPRALGPPSASSGWMLAGRAPAAVIAEPEGVGSCVLLVRDLTTPPSLLAPGGWYVTGRVPGVGVMHMAVVLEDNRDFDGNYDSFSSVLEAPGLEVSYPPSAYTVNGGFVSTAAIYGVSGVLVSQAENLSTLGSAVPGVPDASGAGIWNVYGDPLGTHVALAAGPGAPRLDLPVDLRVVQTARPGHLFCTGRGSSSVCTRVGLDGTVTELGRLGGPTMEIVDLELEDGTVCGQASSGTIFRCVDADGTEHDFDRLDPSWIEDATQRLPEGRGWYALSPEMPFGGAFVEYVSVDGSARRRLADRCATRPSRDVDGRWWLALKDDGMGAGGCYGRDTDLTITVARLSPTEIEEVSDFPQPRDVLGPTHALAGVVVGREVVLVRTVGSEVGSAGGGAGSRQERIYRLPRSLFPE